VSRTKRHRRAAFFSLDGANGTHWLERSETGEFTFCHDAPGGLVQLPVDKGSLAAWLALQLRQEDAAATAESLASRVTVGDVVGIVSRLAKAVR
jgi:hypothetical protein